MADKVSEETENSSRTTSESKLVDYTLGKAPIEKGERTGSRRLSVPVTQAEKEAAQKELEEIEPPERIPSILIRPLPAEVTSPQRLFASRESMDLSHTKSWIVKIYPRMGKMLHDRVQNRDVDKEESPQFEEDKNLDSGVLNIREDPPDWNTQRDEEVQGEEECINLVKQDDLSTEILQLSQLDDDDSNKESIAESKLEEVISEQGELLQDKEGVSLKEKESEQFGSTHKQWPCLRCEQDNDDFTRNISEKQDLGDSGLLACNHEAWDSVMPNEWWHYFQYDDENERFLPSGSETERNSKPGEHTHHAADVVSYEPGTTSETNTSDMHKLLQEDQPGLDDQEPWRILPTLTERVEILRVQFDAILERNKRLEESLAALTEKENALQVILDRQTQQISSIDERQVEQERVLLAPMRNVYIRQFHDLIREGISQKMSSSFIYARLMWALKQRVNQHERGIRERLAPASRGGDLWLFIKEAHAVAPKLFCKDDLWNEFLDLILEDEEQLRFLGLSAAAVELTRFGRSRPPGARSCGLQCSRQDANFRNELVFAEVVAGQSDELRPLYAELYEFFYKVPPETMYIKGEPDLPGQPVQVPDVKDEAVVV